jgi:ABC-type Zn uptake system ZnuABC Zn-binding protein ZnuA
MKKLVFAATLMVAISFAACGCQTASNQTATDSDSIAVVDSIDSISVDSIVAE